MKLTATGDSGDTSGTNALTIDSDTEGSFGTYHTVPNSYVKVAHKNSATSMDTTSGGATLTTTYSAYISKTQVADTYTGQVIYTLVHPASEEPAQPVACEPGYICYIKGSPSVVGTTENQNTSSNIITKLSPSNYSRDGYGFAGWSDAYDYATNPNAHFYGPIETITTPSDLNTKGLSLYAVWIPSEGSLQDSSKISTLCGTGTGSLTQAPTDGTANLSSVTALTDQRDNQTYAIAKLADGNCWMIENLRLQNTATTGATNTALARGYGGVFTGLAESETGTFGGGTTANSLYSIDGSTDNTISGEYYYLGYRFPRYNNINTVSRGTGTEGKYNAYSYGNYYNWPAAIADTTHYDNSNNSITNSSICPSGWNIPTGKNASGQFGQLDIALGGTGTHSSSTMSEMDRKSRAYPNNFVYAGNMDGATTNGSAKGQYGLYWTSTTYDGSHAYNFRLGETYYRPGNENYSKNYAFSVRCVVSNT